MVARTAEMKVVGMGVLKAAQMDRSLVGLLAARKVGTLVVCSD